MTTTTRTYTVFDGNPIESGPCNWPHATDAEFDGTVDDLLASVRLEAHDCGEYQAGDTLWVTIWTEDDAETHVISV